MSLATGVRVGQESGLAMGHGELVERFRIGVALLGVARGYGFYRSQDDMQGVHT